MLIGFDWLRKHNPQINWTQESIGLKQTGVQIGQIQTRKPKLKISQISMHEMKKEVKKNPAKVYAL
jgi:hypothetical protein